MNGPRFGNSRALAGNRCILGPDLKLAVGALFMIVVPTIIFDALTLPWVVANLAGGWVTLVFAIPLECLSLFMFFKTSLSDPGVIPRPVKVYGQGSEAWCRLLQPLNPAKHQDVAVHGHLFKLKYCSTCCLYRPPRCVHCSVCDNCVSKFDHHCPWVGNCVGARNYRSFIFFIVSTSLYLIVVLVVCPIKFFTLLQQAGNEDWAGVFRRAWEACALTVYSLGFLWFVLGLSGYHSYLISTNQTTYEQIKGYYDDIVNPWNRGALNNFKTLLLLPQLPRLTDKPEVDLAEYCYAHVKNLAGVLPTGKVELSTPLQGSANTTVPPASKSTLNSNFDHSLTHMSSLGSADHQVSRYMTERSSPAFQTVAHHLASPPTALSSVRVSGIHQRPPRQSCSDCLRDVDGCVCRRYGLGGKATLEPSVLTPTASGGSPGASGGSPAGVEEEEDYVLSWWVTSVMKQIGAWGRSWSKTALGQSTCVLPPSEH